MDRGDSHDEQASADFTFTPFQHTEPDGRMEPFSIRANAIGCHLKKQV